MIKSIMVFNDVHSPYGYYQIRKVHEDGSYWVLCFVFADLSSEVMGIAKTIADIYGVEVKDMREVPGETILPQH